MILNFKYFIGKLNFNCMLRYTFPLLISIIIGVGLNLAYRFPMYNSLKWLNSPPKPHAFMALPVQSGFFSTQFRFIKHNLNETSFYTIFLLFFIYIAYRLPTKFMLNELGLLVYFPLFNIVYTLCCAICIAHVRKKELTKTRLVFIGFFGLSVPFMFILFSGYYYELHLHICLTLASLVALLEPLTMFQSTRSPNTPGLGGSASGSGSGSRSGSGSGSGSGSRSGSGSGSGSGSQAAGSGSQAAGSGSQAAGSDSKAAGSKASIPGFGDLLASTVDARAPTRPPSNVPAGSVPTLPSIAGILDAAGPGPAPAPAPASTSAQPIQAKGLYLSADDLTDAQLDHLYGPNPTKDQLNGIREKIIAQRIKPKSRSIYGDYPANISNNGRNATLNYSEQKMIARKLLGARKGYFSQLSGTDSRPCLKVMRDTNLGKKAVHNNDSVVRDLE